MAPEHELLVLKWQFAAALLMGLDYFIPDDLRAKANNYVKIYFNGMQKRVDADIAKSFSEFKGKLFRVFIAIIQISIGSFFIFISQHINTSSIYLLILILSIGGIFIISGFSFAFNAVFEFITRLGIATPFRILTTFLIGSPKGPIAAIGFLCLIISFFLRYSYNGV